MDGGAAPEPLRQRKCLPPAWTPEELKMAAKAALGSFIAEDRPAVLRACFAAMVGGLTTSSPADEASAVGKAVSLPLLELRRNPHCKPEPTYEKAITALQITLSQLLPLLELRRNPRCKPEPTYEKAITALQITLSQLLSKELEVSFRRSPIPEHTAGCNGSHDLCLVQAPNPTWEEEGAKAIQIFCSQLLSKYGIDSIPTRERLSISADVPIPHNDSRDKLGYLGLDKLCLLDTDSIAEEKLSLPLPELKQKRNCSPGPTPDQEETAKPLTQIMEQHQQSARGPIMESTRSDDSGKMGNLDKLCPVGTVGAVGKEKLPSLEVESVLKAEHHSSDAVTWAKLMEILYIVRRHRICEYDPKWNALKPIHFCNHNIAFFDFKRDSTVGCGDPLHKLRKSEFKRMVHSVNVISLKIFQSDVDYPISVYGTVIARDQIDYNRVYLFRRCRDDPQVIKSPEDMLTLTGPNRGLAALDSIFFEVDLKIKDSGTVDKDFSKGVIHHNAVRNTMEHTRKTLISRLSEVELLYTFVPRAVEATLAVNILDGPSHFRGKLTVWTADNSTNHITLYDSEASGSLRATRDGPDGNYVLPLSRSLVAVRLRKSLFLAICALDDDHEVGSFTAELGQYDGKHVFRCGSYMLQVTVTWTTGIAYTRWHNSKWLRVAGATLLL